MTAIPRAAADAPAPVSGNAAAASKDTRGWFLGQFMPGAANPHRSSDLEVKWFTHAKGDERQAWSPASPVRTLNILVRGHFVLRFPDRDVALREEGDYVLFGPGMPHSFRSVEESLVLTIRWPSIPA
jgi:mannose-6-phosphate isomerase-like protein (cupin superfamily)